MNYEDLRRTLERHFKAAFQTGIPVAFPVQFENVTFRQPTGEPWGRFSIRLGDRSNASVGTTHKRTVGLVYLQVFVPENRGTKPATELADRFAAAFDDRELTTDGGTMVQFRSASSETIGLTGEGWHQTNLSVPFWADRIAD